MSLPAATFVLHGIIDQARAEGLAARIRAAVRNGRRRLVLVLRPGTVLASAGLVAFLLRAGEHLRGLDGQLVCTGDEGALAQLRALGLAEILTPASATPAAQGATP